MKKAIITFGLIVFIAGVGFAQFRGVEWGAPKKEVKEAEGGEPIQKSDQGNTTALLYTDTVSGLDVFVLYIFYENQLARSMYSFINEHTNRNDFITDFNKINDLLVEKYKEPENDEINWKNDLYKDDKEDWGTALAIGHLRFYTSWNLEEVQIEHVLGGDNREINHIIAYEHKKLAKKIEKSSKEKDKGKL
jgi:hypothetical protein